jgi:hypothetical protein
MFDNLAIPVIGGLAIGIAFVVLFSVLSAQSQLPIEVLFPPKIGKNAEKAIIVALRNDTIEQMFDGKDMVVTSVRDYGVTSTRHDCPINLCAVIIFAEKPDVRTNPVAVLVNIQSGKVVDITPSDWKSIQLENKT